MGFEKARLFYYLWGKEPLLLTSISGRKIKGLMSDCPVNMAGYDQHLDVIRPFWNLHNVDRLGDIISPLEVRWPPIFRGGGGGAGLRIVFSIFNSCLILSSLTSIAMLLKGSVSWDFWVLFWHVWIDLGLYKNLWLLSIFSVEPLILYLHLKFRRG